MAIGFVFFLLSFFSLQIPLTLSTCRVGSVLVFFCYDVVRIVGVDGLLVVDYSD